MSSNAATTYDLSRETGLGAELCKLALERSKNDVVAARRILSLWGGKTGKPSDNNFGLVCAYFDKESSAAAVVEVKCTDEIFVGTKEFADLVADITTEVVQYEHHYMNESTIEKLEKEHGCTFVINKARIIKSSPLSLLTTYSHRDRIGVVVETSVSDAEAFNHKSFRLFSFDCAMHIAAFAPLAVEKAEMPKEQRDDFSRKIEKDLMRDGKAMHLWSTVIEGKLNKWSEQRSMFNQIFIKSDKDSVDEVRKKVSTKIGSEVIIKQFARLAIGS